MRAGMWAIRSLKQAIDMSGHAAGGPRSRLIPRLLFALAGPALFALVSYAFGWVDVEAAPAWSVAGGFALSLFYALAFIVVGESFIEDLIKLGMVLLIFWAASSYPLALPLTAGLVCGGVCGFLLNDRGRARAETGATERPARNERQPSRAERREEDDRRRRERREAEAQAYRARQEEREE